MDKTTHTCIYSSALLNIFLTHIVSADPIQYRSHSHEKTDLAEEWYGLPVCVLSYLLAFFHLSFFLLSFRLPFAFPRRLIFSPRSSAKVRPLPFTSVHNEQPAKNT
jgi:hypothetical protein